MLINWHKNAILILHQNQIIMLYNTKMDVPSDHLQNIVRIIAKELDKGTFWPNNYATDVFGVVTKYLIKGTETRKVKRMESEELNDFGIFDKDGNEVRPIGKTYQCFSDNALLRAVMADEIRQDLKRMRQYFEDIGIDHQEVAGLITMSKGLKKATEDLHTQYDRDLNIDEKVRIASIMGTILKEIDDSYYEPCLQKIFDENFIND